MIRRLAAGVLGLSLAVSACGDDSSTGPESTPTLLVALSPAVDTLVIGELTDPRVSVRVENSIGSPVEGIPVRFFLAAGEGSVFPGVAVSDRDGIAEASFQAGMTLGEVRIGVDIPSAVDVVALEFVILTEAADSVGLRIVEGDGQRAEIASQLPIPFVVEATYSSGSPAGGIAIAWRLTTETGSARLDTDTTVTGADGRGQVLLTLGQRLGEHSVEARAVRGVASDTAQFAAEAVQLSDLVIRLDSVSAPMVEGESATLFGSGFPSIRTGATEVRIEGEPAEITGSGADRIEIIVPSFGDRCLPAREVGVRVLVGEDASNGALILMEPRIEAVDLEPGEVLTFRATAASACLQFGSADAAREYRVAVQNIGRADGSGTPLRLVARSGEEPRGAFGTTRLGDSDLDAATLPGTRERLTRELELRENVLGELDRHRAVPARPAAGDSTVTRPALPGLGDTLRYRFAIRPDLTASCEDTTQVIEGVVREIRDHLILIEDVNTPTDALEPDSWTALADELDRVVFPTDTAYFGPPADIDGNERVVLLLTPEVNRLTPAGSTAGLGGFFTPLDLASSGSGRGPAGPVGQFCLASNQAEIIYLAVPDPDGLFGDPVSLPQALRNARRIPAHELPHLINAGVRLSNGDGGFAALEETWLDEGLAHFAEEIAGLRIAGLSAGTKLTWAELTATRDALETFNAFHLDNYYRLSLYMLDPNGVPVLAGADPGEVARLQMRGFSWFFLRWLADQEGSVANQRQLFRALVRGGQSSARGVANIEQAVGTGWADLLAGFAVALPVDDSEAAPGLSERFRIRSWDVRDVYANLNRDPASGTAFPAPFALAVTPLDFETSAVEFDVQPSAVKYFSLASDLASPSLALELSGPNGDPLSEDSAPQITVVRIR